VAGVVEIYTLVTNVGDETEILTVAAPILRD
jgi:hypothetical protein